MQNSLKNGIINLINLERGICLSSEVTQRRFFSDFKRYSPLLWNLAVKDIKIKYRRSVLGIAWSILNPLFTMVVLTSVFNLILRATVDNFPTFYIIGASIWTFFAESTTLAMTSIISSAALIKKVYVPKYMFPVEKCIFALINYLFSLLAVFLVMLIQGVYPTWTTLLAVLPIIYCFVFCCGFSLILSALTVFFRDISHLYSVLLTLWMYLTPILYSVEFLEGHKLLYNIVKFNPMMYYVSYLRDVMMYNTIPGLRMNLICIGFAVLFLAIGSFVFKKCEGKFILHI